MDADPYRDTLPRDPYADENPYGRALIAQHLDDRHRQTPSPAGGQFILQIQYLFVSVICFPPDVYKPCFIKYICVFENLLSVAHILSSL